MANDNDESIVDDLFDVPPWKRQRIMSKRKEIESKNDDNENEIVDTLSKLKIGECGNITFIKLPQLFENAIRESGADMAAFKKVLQLKENAVIGSPENTIHPCKQHIQKQMQDKQVRGRTKSIIDSLLARNDLDGASTSLKIALTAKK